MVRATVSIAVALLLGAPTAALAKAERPCWKTLITDWADGRIDGTYRVTCYRQAIAKAPEDMKIYSSLEEDVQLALHARARSLTLSTRPLRATGASSIPWALLAAGGACLLMATATGSLVALHRLSGSRSRARSEGDVSPPPG